MCRQWRFSLLKAIFFSTTSHLCSSHRSVFRHHRSHRCYDSCYWERDQDEMRKCNQSRHVPLRPATYMHRHDSQVTGESSPCCRNQCKPLLSDLHGCCLIWDLILRDIETDHGNRSRCRHIKARPPAILIHIIFVIRK